MTRPFREVTGQFVLHSFGDSVSMCLESVSEPHICVIDQCASFAEYAD